MRGSTKKILQGALWSLIKKVVASRSCRQNVDNCTFSRVHTIARAKLSAHV